VQSLVERSPLLAVKLGSDQILQAHELATFVIIALSQRKQGFESPWERQFLLTCQYVAAAMPKVCKAH
jgi:hypothetical protein